MPDFPIEQNALSAEEALARVISTLLAPEYDITRPEVLAQLAGRRVLLRADLNLPVTDGVATDTARLDAVMPTVQMLMGAGAKLLIASHFGRPDPKKQSYKEMAAEFSLRQVATLLSQRLPHDRFLGLAEDCVGPAVQAAAARLAPGQVLLLENTRFHAGDTANSAEFSAELAALCEVFVNDAFGVVHRDQASVTGITNHLVEVYPGPLVRRELTYLQHYLSEPVRPLGVVIGGSKVADKIGVLWSLIRKADVLVVGGRMAFTFLAAQGIYVGQTQVEEAWIEDAKLMLAEAQKRGVKMLLPSDVIVSDSLDEARNIKVVPFRQGCCTAEMPCVPSGCYGVDIGPESSKNFVEAVSLCKTLFWNGPLGKFEVVEFAAGTMAMARAIAAAGASHGAITVIGGGDSVAAINQMGVQVVRDSITHVSTGGGASLELIEAKAMPGLRALCKGTPGCCC